VELEPGTSGLSEVSYAKCEDVKSVSEYRLITRTGFIAEEASFQIRRVLGFLLDI
jgi:mRNA interferase MazF